MMKKRLTVVSCGLFVVTAAFAESVAGIGSVRLKGYLEERLTRMVDQHVIGTDVDYITAPFLEKTGGLKVHE